jgi:hypothetical protein
MQVRNLEGNAMRSRNLRLFAIGTVIFLLIMFVICIFIVPPRVYPERTVKELGVIKVGKERADVEDARLKLQNDFRTTLIQAVVGSVALLGAAVGAVVTYQQLVLNRRGHITDRITKAVEQIDTSKSHSVRVGGIYALKQVAQDTPENRDAMAEILVAYVQEQAGPSASSGQESIMKSRQLQLRRPDVHAAMTALSRMFASDWIPSERERAADTGDTRSNEDVFKESILQLPQVDLRGAVLRDANLGRSFMSGVNLTDAVANHAVFCEADLTGAILCRASLVGADLYSAILTEADLRGAELYGADLRRADLSGTKLRGASAHRTYTRWPSGFSPDDHGIIWA